MATAVVFTIPGMWFLKNKGIQMPVVNPWILAALCVTGGVLGILLSVPIRRAFIDEEKLPYASGTAGAEVLIAGDKGGRHALIVTTVGLATGLFALTRDLYHPAPFAIAALASVGIFLSLYPMPLAVGIGYILGPKISIWSWFLGSAVGWGLFIPMLIKNGFEAGKAIALVQNLGMGIVLGSGIGFFAAYIIPRAKKMFAPLFIGKDAPWYMRITPIVSILAFIVLVALGIPVIAAFVTILCVWMLVTVSARMTGETDIDPLEQFGIIVGLICTGLYVFLGSKLGFLPAFLIVCFVSVVCALAGDIGQDYKTAKIVGTKPKDIIRVDLICAIGAGIAAPFVLEIIRRSYESVMFTPVMPAIQATLVAGSISGFAYPSIFIGGFAFAFLVEVVARLTKYRIPISMMACGIGIFIGFVLSIPFALGGVIRYIVNKRWPSAYHTGVIASAGIMGGEGVAGFMVAALFVAGIAYKTASYILMAIFGMLFILVGVLWFKKK
jgi:uncharacterized oligopeptide transporter (OPT) family protein